MSPRRTLLVALGMLALHEALLRAAAEWSFVAALLSPGPHSALGGLLFGLVFLVARVAVLVVLPSVAVSVSGFHLARWLLRRRPGGQPSPTAPRARGRQGVLRASRPSGGQDLAKARSWPYAQ